MEIKEIESRLISLSGNNADFYNMLKPAGKKSRGVRNPELRKIAKEIAKEDYKWFLENNPLDTFEMDMLYAYVLGYAKDDIETKLYYFNKFVPKVEDWAVNDAFCGDFKIAKKHQKETWDMLSKYFGTNEEYVSRVVSVMLLNYFMDDQYIDQSLRVLEKLNHDNYYAKMGIAWALSVAMAKQPEKTIDFVLENSSIDEWTIKKSIQKMKESRRVDQDKVKTLINKMSN